MFVVGNAPERVQGLVTNQGGAWMINSMTYENAPKRVYTMVAMVGFAERYIV